MDTTLNILYLVVAPSGVGKSTLLGRLVAAGLVTTVVSHTTRERRVGEVDGVDYHYVSVDDFDTLMARNAFCESVEYAGNKYGFLRSSFDEQLAAGPVAVVVEPHGVEQLSKIFPRTFAIFLKPPTQQELIRRMVARGQTEEFAKKRLANFYHESRHGESVADAIIEPGTVEEVFEQASLLIDTLSVKKTPMLKESINWEAVMSAERSSGGHVEVMNVLFKDAEVLTSWVQHDYQGNEGFVYKLADGRIVLATDYFGSCSGCDAWAQADYGMDSSEEADALVQRLVSQIVANTKAFVSLEDLVHFLEVRVPEEPGTYYAEGEVAPNLLPLVKALI